MKRILALFALLCVVAAAPASAAWIYDGNDGNNIWATDGTWRIKFIKNGSTYYVGGWEDGGATLDLTTIYEDLATEASPHVVPFSNIGNQCFQNNKAIETLILPARITSIGANAFNGCTALKTATMPGVTTISGAQAFTGCSSLSTVECPNLKYINGYGTFNGCTSLVELKVSADMTAFSSDTFRSCTSFTTLYTNDATKVAGHVQLPPGVTSLGNYSFYQTKITHVFAPGVRTLNSGNGYVFGGCTLLQEVHLPSVTSIAAPSAFNGATALQTVEISSGLSGTIANSAFSGCTSLESVYQRGNEPVEGLVDLPAGVTKLEWASFQNCKAIEHLVAPGVVDVQNRAFTSCTALRTVRLSPSLSVLHNNNNANQAAFYGCSALVDFYPSTIPNITQLRAGMFNGASSLTNAFDFSGATLSDVSGSTFMYGAKNVPCVRLPASFPKLYEKEFYGLKPGAELHFAGNIPPKDSKNDQIYAGKNGAGNRYKIFVDAETYPAWTNNTVSGASFTAKTAEMESESDYPGVATLGYLNYASSGQNNWLVQEPFYVDVTFYDEDGTTALGVERTLLGGAPAWTGTTPTKASTPQYDYAFAGWSTDGSTVVDLATLRVDAPMSLRAVYTPVLRSYEIEWQWFDGTATHTDTQTLDYGETPSHEPVERAATTEHTYTFQGWSTDGTTVLATIPPVTGPATYVAVFEEKDASATVTVRWLDDDGTTLLGTTWPDKNTAAEPPVSPTKDSTVSTTYAFAGWSTDGTTVLTDLTVAADTDFIAVYTPSVRRYAVSFLDWDESVLSALSYDYGTSSNDVAIPADPTRPATPEYTYAFAGWDAPVTNVVGAATYTAVYTFTTNVYAATFRDGVDGSTILGPTNYAYGAAVEAPEAPEHYGFTFSAWSPAVGAMPAADMTYTAVYSTNRFTITWANGNETTSAKYDYLTPTNAIAVPTGTKSTSEKASYVFLGWEPTLEPVQSNTTYTAMFQGTILSPMKLRLAGSAVESDVSGATITATLGDYSTPAVGFSAGIGAALRTQTAVLGETATGTASVDEPPAVVASFSALRAAKGYDWTLTATQWIATANMADVGVLHGRFYAKPPKTWFTAEQAVFENGVFRPTIPSAASQQVRLHATMTFPTIPSRVHPDTTGAVTGIDVWQPNAGWPLAYYAWNGAKWVRLKGAIAKLGEPVELLGVIDFAIKGGTMTWYADGAQLTDEDGNWAIPMSLGPKQISRFVFDSETAMLDSLSGDFDLGFNGVMLLIK